MIIVAQLGRKVDCRNITIIMGFPYICMIFSQENEREIETNTQRRKKKEHRKKRIPQKQFPSNL